MSFKKLKKMIDIDDKFTKSVKEAKDHTKISDSITLLPNYNAMADILFLPTTKLGYKYLLVVVDLATHEFDIEPLKLKESKEVLRAMEKIFQRKYISMPQASIRTDNGTEFKGVVDKYMKDHHIFHSVSMPYRHQQLSMVESLNRTLGILLNGYMNTKTKENEKYYNEWTDIIDVIRKELNAIRYTKPPYTEKTIFNHVDEQVDMEKKPKFKEGQLVYYKLSYPEDALGHKQPTAQFRIGDYRWSTVPVKITQILYYSGKIPYRYLLENMPYVSFTEHELKKSKKAVQEFIVNKIIGKKIMKKKVYYQVLWKGYLKKDATWEPKTELIKDNLQDYIDQYENESKKSKSKK